MLSQRQKMILKLIIDDFINTGEPVGSRTLSKRPELGVSPATVRNDMADLEELGYIMQPHVSAGRVPSELGLRLYVDSLLDGKRLERENKDRIRALLLSGKLKVDEAIENAAKLLSDLTGMAAVITMPQFIKSRLVNMKLVRISENRVMFIMVADNEVVRTFTLNLSGAPQDILDEISDSMLADFRGATIEDINLRSIYRLKLKHPHFGPIIDYLLPLVRDALKETDKPDVKVCGAKNILGYDGYVDKEKALKVMSFLEDSRRVVTMADSLGETSDITVKIGHEITEEDFGGLSMVSAAYSKNENNVGRIIVVGPTRMDYGKVIPVVEYFRKTLSDIFSGINL